MPKSLPYQLTVKSVNTLTPNMQRIVMTGEDLSQFPWDSEGGYIKLVFPAPDEIALPSVEDIETGAPIQLRTYTIRGFDSESLEITVDLVLHDRPDHTGPAANWAKHAVVGDRMVIYGPGNVKPLNHNADWFLLAGDMTALPAISCQLESMPADANGFVILEINNEADKQSLSKPEGMEIIWVINPHADQENTVLSDAVKSVPWLEGKPSIWAACEFSNMRLLRAYFKKDKQVTREHLYVSSYWKMGQTEDKHKIAKRIDAEAES